MFEILINLFCVLLILEYKPNQKVLFLEAYISYVPFISFGVYEKEPFPSVTCIKDDSRESQSECTVNEHFKLSWVESAKVYKVSLTKYPVPVTLKLSKLNNNISLLLGGTVTLFTTLSLPQLVKIETIKSIAKNIAMYVYAFLLNGFRFLIILNVYLLNNTKLTVINSIHKVRNIAIPLTALYNYGLCLQ